MTITAGTGLGKTSVIKELVYHIYKTTEQNIGMIMLEESPKITALDIMGVEANLPLRRPDISLSKDDNSIIKEKTNQNKDTNGCSFNNVKSNKEFSIILLALSPIIFLLKRKKGIKK